MTANAHFWIGVSAGVVFGLVNFWLLSRIVRGMVQAEKVKKSKTLLFFLLKIGLIVLIIGLILEKAYVSPLPFLGGFTVSLIAAICAFVFKSNFRGENN
ncbi:MAG TPA: ATP synthase subunit I [bacterium]|nr:ATP synthase subunit I [bacterium]